MSQHDFNIANQGFPATRSDINNALAALASTSSGTSEPSTTYANQFWYDTTNNLLKFRNEADSAWITLAYLDQGTNEWEIRSAVIQAVDSAGVIIKTDDGTTRVTIQDDGDVSVVGELDALNLSLAGNTSTSAGSLKCDQVNIEMRGSAVSTPNVMLFKTSNTEQMRVNAQGDLLIGKSVTTQYESGCIFLAGTNGSAVISSDNDTLSIWADNLTANTGGAKGHVLFKRGTNGVLVGSITSTTTSTSYNTSSDHRLKENVTDVIDGITRVKQLQPKRFNFISDASDTIVDGFLAHEAQSVVPEAVTGTHNEVDDDGNPVYQGIDQSKLVPLLTAALQEAITKIEDLETRVAALESA